MKLVYVFVVCLQLVKGQHDYKKVLGKSILFYEAQRSGKLPNNNRISWRADSALNDGSDVGVDLSGGWYDAGDHVKFGFPMAWSTTTLAWGIWQFRSAYQSAGELNHALSCIKWPLDYFLKASKKTNELYGQVGNGYTDHSWWGRPEDMTMGRPSFKINLNAPGSDLAGETSAAMAAGYLVFKATNPTYATTLLNRAKSLHEFAYNVNHRGIYSNSISNAGSFYRSSGFRDELAWSAIWLYHATKQQKYMNQALEFYDAGQPWAFSWDAKQAGVQVLMYKATKQAKYSGHVENFLRSWFPGRGMKYTPKGLAWRDKWGPLRYSANTAAIALLAAAEGIISQEAQNWARGQIGYMLGDGGRSYVCGHGNNPPKRPHHRAASCNPNHNIQCNWNDFNSQDPNDSILTGALVGGPDQNDLYEDKRQEYVKNEVATDYNAGFQTALAGLVKAFQMKKK